MNRTTIVILLVAAVFLMPAEISAQEPPTAPPSGWGPITLVIGGEKDGADYPGGARRVAETVQNRQLRIIPNVGHDPQFEAPQLLYPPLLRFLKGEDVGTRKTGAGRQTN
jgi:hypothetical protein